MQQPAQASAEIIEALRESEERFRTLVQFSFDVYWETDAQHRFTRQEFADTLTEVPVSEIGKRRWEVPYLEPDEEGWRKHREMLDAHLPFRDFELARPTPEGGKRYVSVSGLPVFDQTGRFMGYRGVGRHITDRKRSAEIIREMQAELTHANRAAAMGQVAASIAHEVSQPIMAMLLNAEAALSWLEQQPPDVAAVQRTLESILTDANRAGEVINWIRALIKKAPTPKESIDVNQAIEDVLTIVRSELLKHGVSLQTDLAVGLPRAEGYRVQLQQVVLNLILNAIEAMSGRDDGEREIRIDTTTDAANTIVVTVRDNGPGLDPELLGQLFQPFITTKPEGIGMGLAICDTIVRAHGGRLTAGANEPRGAVFQFTLRTQHK
jgi:signal transduction histidine kinase